MLGEKKLKKKNPGKAMNCKLGILAKRVFCLNWRGLTVLDGVVESFNLPYFSLQSMRTFTRINRQMLTAITFLSCLPRVTLSRVVGGRQVLSPLRHPCSPNIFNSSFIKLEKIKMMRKYPDVLPSFSLN